MTDVWRQCNKERKASVTTLREVGGRAGNQGKGTELVGGLQVPPCLRSGERWSGTGL